MDWIKLLSSQKFGGSSASSLSMDETRNVFERDFDRIVFSSAFRRLQDKTQVVPLPESDFVHTRLTHSLETSCVGRSLGRLAGKIIIERNPGLEKAGLQSSVFGSIVAAACLAHDIGNPPFGHSGEKAIGDFFSHGNGAIFKDKIGDEKKWNDLIRFEGNANGFRTVSNPLDVPGGGLRLSFATLAAFSKYPKESLPTDLKGASGKKFGYFQSEKKLFGQVADTVGLIKKDADGDAWFRHPLAFLVEAADDICYSIIDFEDGLRLGLIPSHYAVDLLVPIAGSYFRKQVYDNIISFNEKVGYLRAVAINSLVDEMVQVFAENEEKILNGTFDTSLIKYSRNIEHIDNIKKLSLDLLYRSRSVIEIEAAGFEVISGLIDVFINALMDQSRAVKSHRSEKMLGLLPAQVLESSEKSAGVYELCMLVCEYVAGMTDTYALSLYRKLKGIEIPVRK